MITITVRKTGVIRRAWRLFIRGGNNEPFGHAYNQKASAVEQAVKLISSDEPVLLIVEDPTLEHYSDRVQKTWLRGPADPRRQ